MPSVGPTRLADDFWLVAYDNVVDRPRVGGLALGVGLGAGLLSEAIAGGFVELRDGELFRTKASTDDRALRPVLTTMDLAEQRQQARHRALVGGWRGFEVPDWAAPHVAGHPVGGGDSPGPGLHPHRQPGHNLRDWLSLLAKEGRAEGYVIDRLSRSGLIERKERRRFLREPSVRYVPFDSVAASTPSTAINTAVQRGLRLDHPQLMLAGLFLATGLHFHAMATLGPRERSRLAGMLRDGLDAMSRELLRTADSLLGDAAMR